MNADEAEAEAAGLDGAATYGAEEAEADNTTVEAAEAGGAIEGEAAGREPPSTEEDRGRCF